MKIYFGKVKNNNLDGIKVVGKAIHFSATKPTIIQPLEIMRIPINYVIQIGEGAVLNISTHPNLTDKVGEIFPALITIDDASKEKPLELAVRNAGRNPINLMPGDLIGIGHLVSTENINPEEIPVDFQVIDKIKSKPPKKNTEVKFEVKN